MFRKLPLTFDTLIITVIALKNPSAHLFFLFWQQCSLPTSFLLYFYIDFSFYLYVVKVYINQIWFFSFTNKITNYNWAKGLSFVPKTFRKPLQTFYFYIIPIVMKKPLANLFFLFGEIVQSRQDFFCISARNL